MQFVVHEYKGQRYINVALFIYRYINKMGLKSLSSNLLLIVSIPLFLIACENVYVCIYFWA